MSPITIKQLMQNFCYRINVPAPSAFIGVASPTEQQYTSLFQFIGDNLRNRPYQWPQLKRTYTFNTEVDVRKYQLPGDFYRILESTQWDGTNQWPMRGPISDYNFAVRQYAVVSLQTRKAYRIIGPINYVHSTTLGYASQGWFEIDPTGANDTDELIMWYVSRNWIWPQLWQANHAYTQGNLVSGNGYTYVCITSGTSSTTIPSIPTGEETDGTVVWRAWIGPYECTPSNAGLSDSDICLFDEDIMIEGMRWAYFRAKKMDYMQERTDWENMLKSAYARFNGPTRINMSDEFADYADWPNVPAGDWSV